MKKIRNIRNIMLIVLPVTIFITVFAIKFWAQEECIEYTIAFEETFGSPTTYKDVEKTSAMWTGNGEVTLSWLGANFSIEEPSGMGAKIYVCDAGDFDGDGYPDLIGLDIENNYRLILARNYYYDGDGDGEDDDGIIFFVDPSEVYDEGLYCGPASITAADYNGDGLQDFFFMKNNLDEFGYTDFVAAMYINVGTATDPDFYSYQVSPNLDFSSRFMTSGIYINWAGDHLCSVDIDDDDDMDLLVISQDKIFLVRNPGAEDFNIDSFEIAEINYDQTTGFNIGRGGTSVDAVDFDGDGDVDIIGGTVNDISYLVYYENDGTEGFTRHELTIPNDDCTGTVAICVADFNHDGRIDIFAATDRWNAGNEARMWFMKNQGIVDGQLEFEFRCLNMCQPILPDPHDVDMSALMDYDLDGDMDVILADANHSGDYFLVINDLAPVYTTYGEAWSTNVTPDLNPAKHAITSVRMSNLDQSVRGGSSQGLTVDYYISNNGRDWEFYARFGTERNDGIPSSGALHTYASENDLPWHEFTHFGSQLMWKAILYAEEDDMEDYEGASFETPVIDRIAFSIKFVDRREYSRTSVAARLVDESGQPKKLIIGGTFYFPGWQGHIRAYDVTNISPVSDAYSNLRTITRPDLSEPSGRELVAEGVEIRWDAGELLNNRAPGDRTIYTAVPGSGDSDLQRIGFSTSNIDILGPILKDFQNTNEGLINFVRGEDRNWKLGDINHSNPIIVECPKGDPVSMGSGYENFIEDWKNRPKVLLVGTNDGMLHCFDIATGQELWAFIPNNLLPKLRNMWGVEPNTGERYFVRDVYVDGSPVAADVQIGGVWRTVIICGQGPGKGSSIGPNASGNYYFALDITNIDDPQPMWEVTHETMGETWSVPEIGKVSKGGSDSWVAFMGSGYDNSLSRVTGNNFYAVDLEDGSIFWNFEAVDVDTSASFPNIPNSIPGSPSIIDIERDGYTDAVYFGDLDGRLWKMDVSVEFGNNNSWDAETIYTDTMNYPIITKPALWIDTGSTGTFPRIYFGTGGDDRAPDDGPYSFIALIDRDIPEVDWYLGDSEVLGLPEEKDKGDLIHTMNGNGQEIIGKVWADPKVANYIVYFSTLSGNIESVNPCSSLEGIGKLYARFVWAAGSSVVGGSAFQTSGGTIESLNLEIKTKAAVTLGESERVGGIRKREVYIQEYDSTIQKLEQPAGALLKVKSWREIYKIIK